MCNIKEDRKDNPGWSHRAWSLLVTGTENTPLWEVSKPGRYKSVLPKLLRKIGKIVEKMHSLIGISTTLWWL